MALLVLRRYQRRISHAAQESIDELTETKQILARADPFAIRWIGRSVKVRPIGGDQRFTSVRQNENELQAAGHARVPEDFQTLSFEGMMRARDRHPPWKVLKMGSVGRFPSIESITTN
jgi:hypothetical protein